MASEQRSELNLGHLRVFLLVVRLGSITRAASQLFRAQSAVTRSIQELERVLEEALLERHAAGVSLTPVGKVVLERTRRVFTELQALSQWCALRRQAKVPAVVPAALLNTRRLTIAAALARSRHMPSAAQTLGVTQPAVSSAVRILESETGFPIFTRTTRGVRLTEEGETFVLYVRRALNELRHVRDDIAAVQGNIRGHVTVGALPLSRTTLLPEAIAVMHGDFPGVQIATDESAYESLIASLLAGDIDLVLGALRPDAAAMGLRSECLISADLAVLARHGHPLTQLRDVTLRDLRSAHWILPRSNAPSRTSLDRLFLRRKLRPPVPVVETADLAIIRGLLLTSDMIAAIPAEQLRYECDNGSIAKLDIVLPDTGREIGITTRIGSEPSAASRKFIEAVRLVALRCW
jgi:LysR family transcriptional regulator of gallate degradation